ncbi:MAG: cytidylate kinase-like family protein [Bacteroidales bacterium]|nr:cytidylate kinase-like family protein [Bacteroidales bacterium]MDY6443956.1 cytidylate kinase-like family protein [Bacteroidales bacterium]
MNTQQPFIITISRELGSGGHTVGQLLAERLGVRFSDKELIKALREEFHLTTDAIERLKGEKKDWLTSLLRKIVAMPKAENVVEWDDKFVQEYRPDLSSDEIFEAEKQILRGIAEEGSCVIAGRSGFFVLKDFPNKVDIFITAPREKRIQRVMVKQHLSEQEAAAAIDRVDEGRENYIKRYAGTSRYDVRNYDLVINMDNVPDENAAVELIVKYLGVK